MIPNITSTSSAGSGAVLGYDLGGKKGRLQKIEVLAGNDVLMPWTLINNVNKNWEDTTGRREFRKCVLELANQLNEQFQHRMAMNDRAETKMIHISISYSPLDRERINTYVFDDETGLFIKLREKLFREFMKEMGYGETMWVLTSHLGTKSPHDHAAINRILANGKAVSTSWDYKRAQEIGKKLRSKYRLSEPGLTPNSADELAKDIKEALSESCTDLEFSQNLSLKGVELIQTLRKSESGRRFGLAFKRGKRTTPGYKLGKDLTYTEISATIRNNVSKRIAKLKEEFPFRNAKHMQYIIFDHNNAAIYRSDKSVDIPINIIHEKARQALLKRIMFCAGTEGPQAFYDMLLTAKESGSYRVGDIQIGPNDIITFGHERIFGDEEKTTPYFPQMKEQETIAIEDSGEKPSSEIPHGDAQKPVVGKGAVSLRPKSIVKGNIRKDDTESSTSKQKTNPARTKLKIKSRTP